MKSCANMLSSLCLISSLLDITAAAPMSVRNVTKMVDTHQRRSYSIDPNSDVYSTWPKISPGSDTPGIPYCYFDASSRNKLVNYMTDARKRWEKALGDPDTRGVYFDEAGSDTNIIYCYKNNGWNPDLQREGLLVLQYEEDSAGVYSAGAGYNDDTTDTWRHTLTFDPEVYDFVEDDERDVYGAFTHEIGHVLGLQHEHQRPDAWDHVTFACEKLDDYGEAEDWFAEKDRGFTIQQACTDLEYADRVVDKDEKNVVTWKFSAGRFVPFRKDDPDFVASKDFDMNSIMIYGSEAGGDTNKNMFPLVQKNGQRIKGTREISQADIAAVNRMYPPQQ